MQPTDATGVNPDPLKDVNGNPESAADAQVSDAPKVEETKQEQVAREDYERAVKERDKALQRANQLENQRKKEQEESLIEQNRYKELYEQQQAELERENEQKRLVQLRDQAIDSYDDPAVKEIAKKVLAKNPNAFFWGEAQDEQDAQAQVHAQLEAFRGLAPAAQAAASDENTLPVNGNNPLPVAPGAPVNSETPAETLARLDKKFAQQG